MADTVPSKVAREQTFFNWMDGRCRTPAAALAVVTAVLFISATDAITARGLVVSAFQLKERQIVGGPAWIATEPFTIEAARARIGLW